MQITLSTSFGLPTLGIESVSDSLALYSQGGEGFLLYGSDTTNEIEALSLGAVASPGSGFMVAQEVAGPSFTSLQPGSGLTVQVSGLTTRLFSFGATGGTLTMQTLGADGLPGPVSTALCNQGPLVGVTTFEILGGPTGDQAVLSFANYNGLKLYSLSGTGVFTYQSTYTDTNKTYLGNVSDTLSVTVGGLHWMLSLSSLEGGITSFSVDAAGHVSLVDSLGTIDGLPASGAAAMQSLVVGGVTYVVIAATGSSALSVVRINDMGCLFATDTLFDDLTTRFSHPVALDTFTWAGRSFVVSGGSDAGLQVFELRPDGKLTPFATGIFETGGGLGAITGLEAAVSGNRVDFYVVDAGNQRILDYTMDLGALGGRISAGSGTTTGTGQGDFLWGSGAAQVLDGAGGDDWIFDGAGADTLTGGAGADVFLFAADGVMDTITDFELHKDRINLSDWGRIYSAAALTITPSANGATLSWGGQSITIISATGHSLSAASFTDDDFIFI